MALLSLIAYSYVLVQPLSAADLYGSVNIKNARIRAKPRMTSKERNSMDEAPQTSLSDAKNSFSFLCLALVAGLIVANIVCSLAEFIIVAAYDETVGLELYTEPAFLTYTWYKQAVNLAFQTIVLLVAVRIMRTVPTEPREQENLSLKDFFVFLLCCFPIEFFGALLGNLLASVLTGGNATNPVALMVDNSLSSIINVVILGPLMEEFIFRKQLIDRCGQYGEKNAILFSALCFALFHSNLYQFFNALGTGLILGYVYIRTQKLLYPTLMHMLLNMKSGLMGMISSEGVAVAVVVVLSAAGLAALILKARKLTFLPAEKQIPREEIFRTTYLNWGFAVFFFVMLLCSFITLFVGTG